MGNIHDGQRNSLSYLLECMEQKGFCVANGNKDKHDIKSHPLLEFSKENSDHGRDLFSRPRWFRIGKPITDVATQVKIAKK
mmetsp:Transcript_26786/g.57561  ORF Transcript_26786/g.57561 Transcript_26786/m.57561 type:complete len:81 (+) Transcript_26786:336-578(+)